MEEQNEEEQNNLTKTLKKYEKTKEIPLNEEDTYWEDWNKKTMDEQNETGPSHVSDIQHSDKGKNKMDNNEN
ncbi:unnamed protein product [Meloidogyne enterolobii]